MLNLKDFKLLFLLHSNHYSQGFKIWMQRRKNTSQFEKNYYLLKHLSMTLEYTTVSYIEHKNH